MFLFFAFAGTQVANIGAGETTSTTNSDNGFSPIVLLYIAVSFGFSLMVNVWIFFRISGGESPSAALSCQICNLATHLLTTITHNRPLQPSSHPRHDNGEKHNLRPRRPSPTRPDKRIPPSLSPGPRLISHASKRPDHTLQRHISRTWRLYRSSSDV